MRPSTVVFWQLRIEIQAYSLGLRPLFWPSARFEGFFGLREALRPLSGQKIPQNGPQAKTKPLGPNNKPGSQFSAAKKQLYSVAFQKFFMKTKNYTYFQQRCKKVQCD